MERYFIKENIDTITIKAGEVETFKVVYGDYETLNFEIDGNLEDFSYHVNYKILEIAAIRENIQASSFSGIKKEIDKIHHLVVYVPTSWEVAYSFELVGSTVRFNHEEPIKIKRIKVDGLGIRVMIHDVETTFNINGVKSTLRGEGISGICNIDGLKTLVHIHDPKGDLEVISKGASANVWIEVEDKSQYNYQLFGNGVRNKIDFFGESNVGFGEVSRQQGYEGALGTLSLRVDGLSSKITLNS